jgi:hypothetical protein
MARYIHCIECAKRKKGIASIFDELYEYEKGFLKVDVICDGCDIELSSGQEATAAVLLDSKFHHNYENHKPSKWKFEYFENPASAAFKLIKQNGR